MKAAVLHEFDERLTAKEFVRYEEVTDPRISRPTDVIVRIGGAGVCRMRLFCDRAVSPSGQREALSPCSRRLATGAGLLRD